MAITKSNIINQVSERLDLSPAEAKSELEILLETMKSTLASGENLMISGFGKFLVKDKVPIFTWMARSLFNLPDSMATPCSVNARGHFSDITPT